MGVRGSICVSDFMVGAGAPGGVSAPCPKAECRMKKPETVVTSLSLVFINYFLLEFFCFWKSRKDAAVKPHRIIRGGRIGEVESTMSIGGGGAEAHPVGRGEVGVGLHMKSEVGRA